MPLTKPQRTISEPYTELRTEKVLSYACVCSHVLTFRASKVHRRFVACVGRQYLTSKNHRGVAYGFRFLNGSNTGVLRHLLFVVFQLELVVRAVYGLGSLCPAIAMRTP